VFPSFGGLHTTLLVNAVGLS